MTFSLTKVPSSGIWVPDIAAWVEARARRVDSRVGGASRQVGSRVDEALRQVVVANSLQGTD